MSNTCLVAMLLVVVLLAVMSVASVMVTILVMRVIEKERKMNVGTWSWLFYFDIVMSVRTTSDDLIG